MGLIPYLEYTKLERDESANSQWYYMSHLSNACAAEDAHRTSAYAICLLSEGKLQLETDLFVRTAVAPAVFTIVPSAIRKFTDLGTKYDAKILFFRKEVFLEGQTDINYLDRFSFFDRAGQQLLPLDNSQLQTLETYFDLIHKKSLEPALHRTEVIRSLINIVLNEIGDIHLRTGRGALQGSEKGSDVLFQFKSLLSHHFIEQRQVSFYAERLNLTPKYFSTLIREASGKTAGAWINEMLVLESKVRLQNHDQSITRIAYELNFSDASHFGRFFKKHTGMSPLEYRGK